MIEWFNNMKANVNQLSEQLESQEQNPQVLLEIAQVC